MKELFDIENNVVVFAPQTLAIKEFKDIWDKDKSKDKNMAFKEMSYIFYKHDYRSVYSRYFEEEREIRIIEDLQLVNWKADSKVKTAEDKYKELSKTQSMGLLEDAEFSIEQLRFYFRNINFIKVDNNGKPLYTAKDLMANIKQLGQVIKGIKELKEEIKKEEQSSNAMRGGREKSAFEDPDIIKDI